MTPPQTLSPEWRLSGSYLPNISSKAALFDETRQFLLTLDASETLDEARSRLVEKELPQRSRTTRQRIAEYIVRRLVRWEPPAWVLADLIAFARDRRPELLQSALLLHVPRQDVLLYDVVQEVILPRWKKGEQELTRSDIQRFLDIQEDDHPEIGGWSHTTRQKVAGNTLSLLRDYGLLRGNARKTIVEPLIFPELPRHLTRLLREEGVREEEIPFHPDWQLWLWDSARVRAELAHLERDSLR